MDKLKEIKSPDVAPAARPGPAAWQIWVAAWAVRFLRWTCRVQRRDESGTLTGTGPWPAIFVGWHNRVLLMPMCFPRALRRKGVALASKSRDGEFAAQFLKAMGIDSVRGSSSRGGFRALVELRRHLNSGNYVFITPDGPRGPRYDVHPGAAALAEKTGFPIIPVSLNMPARWELKGWDRTQIAKPFSRIEMIIGAPLHIPPNLTEDQRQEQQQRVRQALLDITDDERLCGR